MNTLTPARDLVNFRLHFPADDAAAVEDLADDVALAGVEDLGHQPPPAPTFETSEWIDAQASYYRSLGHDLGDLLARTLGDLAQSWRVLSQGEPITVETFEARSEVMQELACEGRYL